MAKTIYSNRGTKREVADERYAEFKTAGWHDTNPLDIPETTPETTPEASAPIESVETPTEISTEVLDTPVTTEEIQAQVTSPTQGLQDVFGQDWTPAPIFEQLGLTEQGIHGAVKVKGMNDVYTIGSGGRKETAESYKERFGTSEQQGIVGEISIEEAKALEITIGADSIVEPIIPVDPYEVWEHFRDEDKAEMDTLRTSLTETTQNLIDKLMGYGEAKAEAKDEAKENLGIDEKDKAISDAQKVRNDLYNLYEKDIIGLMSSTMTASHVRGKQFQLRAQRAVLIAPLDSNLMIAQGSYDRAMDLLDDWSADYNEAMQFQMQAAQMNINMMEGKLNREQAENLAEAQIKFSMWEADYNRNLETQEEVKKLMLAFNSRGANININDSWETALQKTMVYTKSDQEILDRMNEIGLESAEIGLLLQKKSLAGGRSGGYAPSALKKLWTELGGQEGTGKTLNEFYQSEKGGGDESVLTFQSALEDTASYLTDLRAAGKLSDMSYSQAIDGFMSDFGLDDKGQVESAINNIMSGGSPIVSRGEENVGSDFDYTPLVFKDKKGIAKSRADLPNDVKLIYDELKRKNPYSSAAFLIREALGANK